MAEKQSINIRQISKNRAEQVGFYRFLENENVIIGELVKSVADHCEMQIAQRYEGKHILVISDTSEVNLQKHVGRLKPKGIGVVGNNQDVGFYVHPALALDAENGFPIGLSALQIWTREPGHLDKEERNYQQVPIEEKESYKWLKSIEETEKCCQNCGLKMITYIGDRESDIYEEFVLVRSKKQHIIARASQNRRLKGKSELLFSYLSQQPCEGTYSIQITNDPRQNRQAREALLMVRCAKVEICRPHNLTSEDGPDSVEIYALEAVEVQPPAGQKPVHWRLLTTHTVVCLEQALTVIQWYAWRWRIEQLFATLKTVGLDIEATQLESGFSIQRLTVLALSVAVRILQMLVGREQPGLPAALAFSAPEQQCLSDVAASVNGRTQKQLNPHPPGSLAWATWIIARLGGWSGFRSQKPPGIPTLVSGLRQFESLFHGWQLALGKVVCTP
jgi:hypothetical protein